LEGSYVSLPLREDPRQRKLGVAGYIRMEVRGILSGSDTRRGLLHNLMCFLMRCGEASVDLHVNVLCNGVSCLSTASDN
jgi:hypothetical protein